MIFCSPLSRFPRFQNYCRLRRPPRTNSVDCLSGSLNFISISGKEGEVSSMDSKQKTVPVWRPVATVSGLVSNMVKGSSSHPTKESFEKLRHEKSTAPLSATSSSEAVNSKEGEVTRETTLAKFNKGSEKVNRDGKYSVSIQVDAPLVRFVKGKWGLTQKQIEEENNVRIIFPSVKDEISIVIEGASGENVNKASEKITKVLEQAVKSPSVDYSHFVSLPLAIHPELAEKLHSFQKSVLEEIGSSDGSLDEKALGIDSSIFIKPQHFHLTVLMLKLWNKDRVAIATEVLKNVSSKVMGALENRPISIRLNGLACMRGSPAKARVIYAPVEEVGGEGRLLRACQVIIDAYVEAGLVLQKDAHQSLNLHATLMNARHRKRNKWSTKQESFDARDIFKKFGSEDWGEYAILEAHLSQRFVYDESGYYHCCGSIPFSGGIKVEQLANA